MHYTLVCWMYIWEIFVSLSTLNMYKHRCFFQVSFSAYMCIQSLLYVVGMIPIVVTTGLLSQFNFGRHLLIKYPRFFSCGMFSDSGPTRKQIEDSSFSHTFLGYGHDGEETDEKDAPKKKIVIRVSGPDAGYISTPICMVQAAYVVLSEQEKMPPKWVFITTGSSKHGGRAGCCCSSDFGLFRACELNQFETRNRHIQLADFWQISSQHQILVRY